MANHRRGSSPRRFDCGTKRPANATKRAPGDGRQAARIDDYRFATRRRRGLRGGCSGAEAEWCPAHSKWGRHCCRPHSHRRVDAPRCAIVRRTFRLACAGTYLAPDVWPRCVGPCGLPLRDSSPALAPASGFRSCTASIRSGPEAVRHDALHIRLAEAASLYRSVVLRGSSLRLALRFPSSRPGSRPVRCHRVAPFSNDPTCIWPKPLACRLSTGAWTDVTAIFGVIT
jgi:hypothetical protein